MQRGQPIIQRSHRCDLGSNIQSENKSSGLKVPAGALFHSSLCSSNTLNPSLYSSIVSEDFIPAFAASCIISVIVNPAVSAALSMEHPDVKMIFNTIVCFIVELP